MEYQIILPDKSTQTVEGKSISIPGYDGFDFFVYKSGPSECHVRESSTGLRIVTGTTIKMTIAKAKIEIDAQVNGDHKKLQEIIDKKYKAIK